MKIDMDTYTGTVQVQTKPTDVEVTISIPHGSTGHQQRAAFGAMGMGKVAFDQNIPIEKLMYTITSLTKVTLEDA